VSSLRAQYAETCTATMGISGHRPAHDLPTRLGAWTSCDPRLVVSDRSGLPSTDDRNPGCLPSTSDRPRRRRHPGFSPPSSTQPRFCPIPTSAEPPHPLDQTVSIPFRSPQRESTWVQTDRWFVGAPIRADARATLERELQIGGAASRVWV